MADRRLILAHDLRGGQRVYVEPQHDDLPRGAKLGPIPTDGHWQAVDDYLHGCAQRGAVHCYDREPLTTDELKPGLEAAAAAREANKSELARAEKEAEVSRLKPDADRKNAKPKLVEVP